MHLRFLFYTLLFLLSAWESYGQSTYLQIDERAKKINGRDLKIIHSQLDLLSASDSGKARAFFTWIAHNIRYDVDEYKNPSPNADNQEAEVVIKTKKGVCQGYSNLFAELCNMSALECVLISGHIRQDGRYRPYGHAWNAVKIAGRWRLVDATWGAGVLDEKEKYQALFDDSYFLSEPERFIEEHYPFDPLWQLLPKPVSLVDYRKSNWKYNPAKPLKPYAFQDTLTQWLAKDSVTMLLDASKRILEFNSEILEAKEVACHFAMQAANICFNRAFVLQESTDWESDTESKKKIAEIKALYKQAESCLALIGIPPIQLRSTVDNMKKTIKHNLSIVDDY